MIPNLFHNVPPDCTFIRTTKGDIRVIPNSKINNILYKNPDKSDECIVTCGPKSFFIGKLISRSSACGLAAYDNATGNAEPAPISDSDGVTEEPIDKCPEKP